LKNLAFFGMATLNNTYPLNSDLIVKNKSVFSKTSKLRQNTPDVAAPQV
jgi:hypothetical protein